MQFEWTLGYHVHQIFRANGVYLVVAHRNQKTGNDSGWNPRWQTGNISRAKGERKGHGVSP